MRQLERGEARGNGKIMKSRAVQTAVCIAAAAVFAAAIWFVVGSGTIAGLVGIVTAGLLLGLASASSNGSKSARLGLILLSLLIVAGLMFFAYIVMSVGGMEH